MFPCHAHQWQPRHRCPLRRWRALQTSARPPGLPASMCRRVVQVPRWGPPQRGRAGTAKRGPQDVGVGKDQGAGARQRGAVMTRGVPASETARRCHSAPPEGVTAAPPGRPPQEAGARGAQVRRRAGATRRRISLGWYQRLCPFC